MRNAVIGFGLFGVMLCGLVPATQAAGERLRGDSFMTVMQDNTLSGTTSEGVAFNVYFLPGGQVTYQEASGDKDSGTWRLDQNDHVCVIWNRINEGQERCYAVTLDGKSIRWSGKAGSGYGKLRGTIADSFLEKK